MNTQAAGNSHDLLVIERADPFPPKIRESLHSKGYTTRIISDIQEAHKALFELVDPILVIHCGSKPGNKEYLHSICQMESLHEYPVLVLGRDVETVEADLNKCFGLATTMKAPFAPRDLLDAVNFISRVYRREKAQSSKIEIEAKSSTPGQSTPVADSEAEQPEVSHPLYDQFKSIPSLFFQQLQSFRLLEKSLGGAQYTKQIRANDLDKLKLLPDNEEVADTIRTVCAGAGKWGEPHLYRTAYLTQRILEPLGIHPETKDHATNAAFLYALSFSQRNRTLLRKEYHGRGTMILRKEICSLIKDSAFQLASELEYSPEAKIVSVLGKLLGKEEVASDDPISVAASAILAADAADRVCFQSGFWNTRGAYGLIRRIKEGKLREPHPAVLCCLVKILAEAITAHGSASLLPHKVRENWELKERALENRDGPVASNEAKVPLSSLTPGMKLSRPLYAFDGRQILSEDLVLDQDLIWRIWQLSAVRPLNAPVVVLRNGKKRSDSDTE